MHYNFPEHKFDKAEINNLASLISSSMLIVPGALLGFVSGTIVFLPMHAVTGLTILGSAFSYFFSSKFIHNEIPEKGTQDDKNEKEALISIATSFRIFMGAIFGLSFGEIFLFKFMPGIWPNLEAFLGLLIGVSWPFFKDFFFPPENITANECVKLSVAFEIMLYTGLVSFFLLSSAPGWLSFYGWGAGLGLGYLCGFGIGAMISNSLEQNENMFAKQSLVNVTLPSIIIGLASSLATTMYFSINSIYFTLGFGFAVSSALMAGTYQIVKYFGDCNDPYSKEVVHNILILTATFFPYTFAGSLASATIYSLINIYTDGLYLAIAGGYTAGASASILNFVVRMYNSLTINYDDNTLKNDSLTNQGNSSNISKDDMRSTYSTPNEKPVLAEPYSEDDSERSKSGSKLRI